MKVLVPLVCFLLGISSISSFSLQLPLAARRIVGGRICIPPRTRIQQIAPMRCVATGQRPRPGDLKAGDLVKWLWNEAQFLPDFPAPSLEFFSDDIVYEDMIYAKPFVGKDAVKEFLLMTKEKAPEDFVFVLDRVSDGERSCGFTWHVELKTRPDAGKFANGCSFYELDEQGRICYIRDIPEPPLKIGSFGLTLANLAAKAIKSTPAPASS